MALSSSNLNLRIISALLLIPFVIGAIVAGGWIFGLFVSLAFGLCCGEWHAMSRRLSWGAIAFPAGLVYFAASFILFVLLRTEDENGLYLILTLMICVWASDTGAYVAGRAIGGPKMAPTISPNKTWSGLAGSVVAAAAALYILLYVAPHIAHIIPNTIKLTPSHAAMMLLYGGVIGYVGQAGDLLESWMKRQADMKDSGALIPGHGGILDRIDALLLVIPVFYAICRYGL